MASTMTTMGTPSRLDLVADALRLLHEFRQADEHRVQRAAGLARLDHVHVEVRYTFGTARGFRKRASALHASAIRQWPRATAGSFPAAAGRASRATAKSASTRVASAA